jgi:predicted SnoaL-like aldol condensation-catalyzing enzyme
MRKIFFFAGLFFCLAACNNSNDTKVASSTMSTQAQKNLDADHVISKAFETGDASGLDSVIADGFVDHTDRGDKTGRDSVKAMVKQIHDHFKDMKMEMKKEMADDDYVFSWMQFGGNSDGTMMPAGPFDMQAIEVTKYSNGKAVEHWEFGNMQDVAKMMQQMNNMGDKMKTMNKGDSSKMKTK